jgi:hypothetical protein
MSLNIGAYDFTTLIPAIAEYIRRDTRPEIRICAEVHGNADRVNCDMHLLESAHRRRPVSRDLAGKIARPAGLASKRHGRCLYIQRPAQNRRMMGDGARDIRKRAKGCRTVSMNKVYCLFTAGPVES